MHVGSYRFAFQQFFLSDENLSQFVLRILVTHSIHSLARLIALIVSSVSLAKYIPDVTTANIEPIPSPTIASMAISSIIVAPRLEDVLFT